MTMTAADIDDLIVYGKANCPFCEMSKQELALQGILFDYIDLQETGKTAAEVTGRKVSTLPQIYIKGKYIGGYDDLMVFLNSTPAEGNDEDDECIACSG